MNVLFIAIDTLRADHMSCYGFDRLTSPHIDRLAEKGVLFEEFFAPFIPTHPGFTTMFTGKDIMTHQIVTQGGKAELDKSITTLPEILKQRGYFTAAADNLMRWFRRGYDLYEGYSWSQDTSGPQYKADAVNETAFRMLDACVGQDKPWFCFVHYWDPHTPYLPPKPFDRMFYHDDETDEKFTSAVEMMTNYPSFQYYFEDWMPGLRDVEFPKAQFHAEIAYCDVCIGTLLDRLQQMQGAEDTLIVITSDHGEELDEHEMWFDHHGLYDTNLYVPLIMAHPGRLPAGLRLGGLTRHQDLPVTILELLGLADAAEEHKMEGVSMVPLIDNEDHAGATDTIFIAENAWMKKRGFRTKQWKFIKCLYDELHKGPPFELYDFAADPVEQVNLADEKPEVRDDFAAKLDQFIEKRLSETGLPDPQMEQEVTMTQVGKPKSGLSAKSVIKRALSRG
jgi:arylsulfatase A-like enzyme